MTKPWFQRGKDPVCPYCQQPAVLHKSSASFYNGRDYGPLWACVPCQAWIGCHPGTTTPLGRLADAELRKAKQAAHAAFDPGWKRVKNSSKQGARNAHYAWLASKLGIPRDQCHIGMFDVELCRRTVELCTAMAAEPLIALKARKHGT